MRRLGICALLSTVLLTSGACSSQPALPRLIEKSDLPGSWLRYDSPSPTKPRFCGSALALPRPEQTASAAYAKDPDNGPIMGERIERYARGQAAKVLARERALELPCEWADSGGRWRMEEEPAPAAGDDGRVFLVTSRDRDDSFNYEVAMRKGDDLLLVVINQRTADRTLVDEVSSVAWKKAVGQ